MCIFRLCSFCFGYCNGLGDPLFIATTKCVAYHDIHKAENVMDYKIILRNIIRSEVFQLRCSSRQASGTLKYYTRSIPVYKTSMILKK
jgi:hypothetical protein